MAPFEQATEVRPPQAPEYNCSIAPVAASWVPILVNAIVATGVPAPVVNLYQTSSSGVPTAQPTAVPLAVAARTVPARGVPEVSVAAEQGASLVGWAETK